MVVVLVDTLLVKIDNLHQVMDLVVVVAVIRMYNLAHPLLLAAQNPVSRSSFSCASMCT